MFESSKRGRRRSVLFAIVVGTAFLAIAAGAGAVVQAASPAVGIVFLVVGLALLGFGFTIATGKMDHFLFDQETTNEGAKST